MLITHSLGVVARYARRINVMYAGRIIERGGPLDIFRNPVHPYTVGLLESVPRLDRPKRSKLSSINGQPPDLSALPAGCYFRPRCKFAIEKCEHDYPLEREVEKGHGFACWAADGVSPRTGAAT
jgi:oligopeptide/dipeptide ABC transporter ATP-binding protein